MQKPTEHQQMYSYIVWEWPLVKQNNVCLSSFTFSNYER